MLTGRTATIVEQQHVTGGLAVSPSTRATTYPEVSLPSDTPAATIVPPTLLQPLLPLDRTCTWSRAPIAPLAPGDPGSWGLERTVTWSRVPVVPTNSSTGLERTTTWSRAPTAAGNATSWGLERTTTWSRVPAPPAEPTPWGLDRTTTWGQVPRAGTVDPDAWKLECPGIGTASQANPAPCSTKLLVRRGSTSVQLAPATAPLAAPLAPAAPAAPNAQAVRAVQPGHLLRSLTLAPPRSQEGLQATGTGPSFSSVAMGTPGQGPTAPAPVPASAPAPAPALRKSYTVTVGELPSRPGPAVSRASLRAASVRGLAMRQPPRPQHDADLRGASVPPEARGKEEVRPVVELSELPEVQPPGKGELQEAPEPSASSQQPQVQVGPDVAGRELLAVALGFGAGAAGLGVRVGAESTAPAPPKALKLQQLRFIVAGIMGSGKSTLCRMLRHLLGGSWVNQDEFSHHGRGAKREFLSEIKRLASEPAMPALIVDKINTLRSHRREILQAMQSGVTGDIVFVQMRHPSDPPGRWENAVRLCESRIRERGQGHRTLTADTPKLGGILRQTASGVEPMLKDELSQFAASLTVDMTLDPIASTMHLLEDLGKADLLSSFLAADLSEEKVIEAMQVSTEVEVMLRNSTGPVAAAAAAPRKNKQSSKLWMWTLDLDADSCAKLRDLWQQHKARTPPSFQCVEDLHVTLLYLGGGSDEEVASRHPNLGGKEEVLRLRETLQDREGLEVWIEAATLIADCRLAALEVEGVSSFCANTAPHITLAHSPNVKPRLSNELLGRRAACAELSQGLGQWLQELGLAEYRQSLLDWCLAMGAATPEELAENAAEASAAVEQRPDARDHVERLLASSVHGELSVEALSEPLRLRGRITGRRRGQAAPARSTSP